VLRKDGLLQGCVTTGHSFGGDLEAVTVHSGLLAARHVLRADVTVVCQGPGNLGTGTPWGFSGVACGEAVNAVAALDGRAVAALRVSEADGRQRHRGISHHSLTAYGRVALARAVVAVPRLPGRFGEHVRSQAQELGARHSLVEVSVDGLEEEIRTLPWRFPAWAGGWSRTGQSSSVPPWPVDTPPGCSEPCAVSAVPPGRAKAVRGVKNAVQARKRVSGFSAWPGTCA